MIMPLSTKNDNFKSTNSSKLNKSEYRENETSTDKSNTSQLEIIIEEENEIVN